MKTIHVSKFFTLAAIVIAAGFSSCSHDENAPDNPAEQGTAYLSLNIQMPSPGRTYADPSTENGTAAESLVSSGFAVTFKGGLVADVVALTAANWGTIGNGTAPGTEDGTAFKVTDGVDQLLLVLNPDATLTAVLDNALGKSLEGFLTGVNNVIEEPIVVAANQFTMLNAGLGSGPTEEILVDCTPSATAALAEAARKTVNVERLASKVTLQSAAPVDAPANVTFAITGWKLNATNKTYIPFSHLVNYALPGGVNETGLERYREDANYIGITGAGNLDATFNWLDNNDNYMSAANPIAWNAVPSFEYSHENTVQETDQNDNNLTKVIIRANYRPEGVDAGASWFRYNGVVYKNMDDMKTAYNAAAPGSNLRLSFDAMLAALGVTGSFSDVSVTINALNDVENGGYKAAKAVVAAGNTVVQYFQNSICYYAVNINHDHRLDPMQLGRWGVVRNNWYTLTVNSVKKPGTPYIPDPTDPDITDPENPDPENPDPADDPEAYLAVTIIVNPWTTWQQGVDL